MPPITLEFIARQRAAVERDIATYQKNQTVNGERICRNRNTGERGITYIASKDRYRTFAHYPYYQYVGNFRHLETAVQARDAYEAQAKQRIEKAIPRVKTGAVVVTMKRRTNSKAVDIVVKSDNRVVMATFCQYDDVMEWLRVQNQFI